MHIGTVVEMREGLAWDRDGVLPFRAAVTGATLADLAEIATDGPGRRLLLPGLAARLAPLTAIARPLMGGPGFPVRAVLFDKTAERNWALGWHQDRTISMRTRREVEGFGPWTIKDGLPHVAPPMPLLESMVTLRLHLDPCGPDNAPLKVAPGSHRLGQIAAPDAARIAKAHPILTCLAEPGDVWAYSTPILHASDRAAAPDRRRVLQVDFAAADLPGGLEWLGVEP
jgi:hypothetical protein